ncbi:MULTISPECIES: VOC family protein [unclassified Arthrobacter]|jgi:methylmalonyl-CoA/ethylmalonyl-CoA epimerase|uniref:VOC family protein n=1 Tax=unclassified Arthrobacter TaxID=235627 RepID=UPI0003805353|nr:MULTISPECIES: VOC family protein [unclassified Arthrobacter]KRE76998.1 methylmalonyl-CoA epimerase [Arthrobacter sp. Soil761]TWD51369.1 methylmalonyl-CoA/ethylmalonyl-CoA epimerase [Arthrobacter sp. AG367]BCW52892.1 glyoxalase [Arthrobacter sp. StoSoilB19]BCW73975.1 glyoxalase [Arthrobacter sp. NicSoilB11]
MRLVQVAQHASDLQRAAEFYSALLSARYTAVFDPPGLLFFDLDGVRLLLEQGAPSSLLYLGVPDVKRTVEQLKGRGVEIVAEPRVIFSHDDGLLGPAGTEEWMAFIRDSEGNTLGLVSQIPPASPSRP